MVNKKLFSFNFMALPLAAGILASSSTIALAQDQAPQAAPESSERESQDQEIIVTARLRDERLIDAPVAITAIGSDTLETYSVSRVADISTLVPSMVAGRAASGSSASIFLRGVGSTALSAGFDQSVSFVIDGLPSSRGREIALPQFDIRGVEVLKGPQALFFGKSTTAGLINITSNDPGNEFEAGIKGGYGFEAREKYAEAYISGPLSDTFGVRLAGRYSNSDGAFRNSAALTSTDVFGRAQRRNSARRGGSENFGARLTLNWEAAPNFTTKLKIGVSGVDDGGATDLVERLCAGNAPQAANGIPPSPNADCKINGVNDLPTLPVEVVATGYRYADPQGRMYGRFRSQSAVLTNTLTSDPFDVTSITSLYHFRQTDLNNVSGESYPATFTQLADYKQFAQEFRFQSKFDGIFNFLAGAFYSHGKFIYNQDAYIFPTPFDPVSGTAVTFKVDKGFKTDSLSFFMQGTFNFGQFELSGGARYSTEARSSYERSLPANPTFAAFFPAGIVLQDRFNDTNFSPEVTLRYKPSEDVTLYAAYKRGFKPGGFNISQTLAAPTGVIDPTTGRPSGERTGKFGSESAEGGEVGLRALLLDRRLAVNVTAYNYTYSDLQVQIFDPVTIGLIAGNAGKLRTRGVEADLNWRVAEGFSLRGAAAYNNAKYKDYLGPCYAGQTPAEGCTINLVGGAFTQQDYSGRTPPKAPKFAGRLGATFEMPLSDALSIALNGDASYTSSYNFTDTLSPDKVQPRFAKIDASIVLSGADDRWTVSLIGRNLTNKLVVTSANDLPFAGGSGTGTPAGRHADMSSFVDNPREIYVEVGFKF